jgi:hypothetical protein
VVETVGLENRCTGNRTGGSNPSPSAIKRKFLRALYSALSVCSVLLPKNKKNLV